MTNPLAEFLAYLAGDEDDSPPQDEAPLVAVDQPVVVPSQPNLTELAAAKKPKDRCEAGEHNICPDASVCGCWCHDERVG